MQRGQISINVSEAKWPMSLVEMASVDLRTNSLSSWWMTTFLCVSFHISIDENMGVLASILVYYRRKTVNEEDIAEQCSKGHNTFPYRGRNIEDGLCDCG